MSPLNAASVHTLWVEWYYLKNNYLTLRSKVKVPRRSLWYAIHRLCSSTHIPNIIDLSEKTKILFKNQLFVFEIKVPRTSLRYETHRLIVMHPHTKYNWPIWKDNKLWSGQASLRRSRRSGICLPSFEGET
jgi:hypothetical protein